jgi:dTDP-4-dehydrorhamnose 3,5-epimerase
MQAIKTRIPDVVMFEPKVFGDARGFFYESFNANVFAQATGLSINFVQDNHSKSANNVLRGLHYQTAYTQGKLVRVTQGEVFDVAVDLRQTSNTFGQWVGERLSADNKRMLWVPAGFAHGFLVLSETAEFLYKTTDFYSPQHEVCIRWDDADIGIEWPLDSAPSLSIKDSAGMAFSDAPKFK